MPTQEKVDSVATLKERLGAAKTAVLTEYRGLSVRQMSELRKQLKAEGHLSRDARAKERKKYGQKGARKRFQFSKR